MTREGITHAILDGMERQGADYYRVNHLRAADIARLADLVVGWCREVGIPVET